MSERIGHPHTAAAAGEEATLPPQNAATATTTTSTTTSTLSSSAHMPQMSRTAPLHTTTASSQHRQHPFASFVSFGQGGTRIPDDPREQLMALIQAFTRSHTALKKLQAEHDSLVGTHARAQDELASLRQSFASYQARCRDLASQP